VAPAKTVLRTDGGRAAANYARLNGALLQHEKSKKRCEARGARPCGRTRS